MTCEEFKLTMESVLPSDATPSLIMAVVRHRRECPECAAKLKAAHLMVEPMLTNELREAMRLENERIVADALPAILNDPENRR